MSHVETGSFSLYGDYYIFTIIYHALISYFSARNIRISFFFKSFLNIASLMPKNQLLYKTERNIHVFVQSEIFTFIYQNFFMFILRVKENRLIFRKFVKDNIILYKT